MSPTVKKVSPNSDYTLNLIFENGEERVFDVNPYLNGGDAHRHLHFLFGQATLSTGECRLLSVQCSQPCEIARVK